jgi:hypothetical protein
MCYYRPTQSPDPTPQEKSPQELYISPPSRVRLSTRRLRHWPNVASVLSKIYCDNAFRWLEKILTAR